MSSIKIGGATLNQIPLDWKNNVANIRSAIDQARSENVKILGLPELCITGYGCEDLFLTDWIYQKTWDILLQLIPETNNILVSLGVPFLHEGVRYNCCVLLANGKLLGITPKQNLASEGVHYESRWFTPGKAGKNETINRHGLQFVFGDQVYEYAGIRIGLEVCEDMWSGSNRPVHNLAEKGVDLILNPSASHFAFGKTKNREKLVLEASESYNLTYLFVNLLGNEAGRMIYDGEILIAQNDRLIAKNRLLSYRNMNLITANVNFGEPGETVELPHDNDYRKEHEFAQAASLGLFDYLRKSRTGGFVLSLSGGADSSCTALLVAEMVRRGIEELGIEAFREKLNLSSDLKSRKEIVNHLLITAYQGTENSSEETLNSARSLAEDIGARFYSWKIDTEITAYRDTVESNLEEKLTWDNDDITLQNIQARARSPIIWMLANKFRYLLLTTSNRSEGSVGYTTMDGDTSGSLAPIAAVDKYFILSWLSWAEANLDYESIKIVNKLTPSAELRPKDDEQEDEKDLMPYKFLAAIERLAIKERLSPSEVRRELQGSIYDVPELTDYIKKFYRLWSINQWKRERIAPAFHLDDFNVDPRTWCRFPILSAGFMEELAELDN